MFDSNKNPFDGFPTVCSVRLTWCQGNFLWKISWRRALALAHWFAKRMHFDWLVSGIVWERLMALSTQLTPPPLFWYFKTKNVLTVIYDRHIADKTRNYFSSKRKSQWICLQSTCSWLLRVTYFQQISKHDKGPRIKSYKCLHSRSTSRFRVFCFAFRCRAIVDYVGNLGDFVFIKTHSMARERSRGVDAAMLRGIETTINSFQRRVRTMSSFRRPFLKSSWSLRKHCRSIWAHSCVLHYTLATSQTLVLMNRFEMDRRQPFVLLEL